MKWIIWLYALIATIGFAQGPIVYRLNWVEQQDKSVTHFVSVSDQYQLNEHKDSLAIPMAYLEGGSGPVDERILLKGTYRSRCLSATGISENDVVYVYNYAKDRLLRF